MNDFDLSDIVFDTLETMSAAGVLHYENDNMAAAAAIIEEWTDSDNQCVLTHYLNDTTETLEKELLYTTDELLLGSFTFVPDTIGNQ